MRTDDHPVVLVLRNIAEGSPVTQCVEAFLDVSAPGRVPGPERDVLAARMGLADETSCLREVRPGVRAGSAWVDRVGAVRLVSRESGWESLARDACLGLPP